jgi:hypothetical protein
MSELLDAGLHLEELMSLAEFVEHDFVQTVASGAVPVTRAIEQMECAVDGHLAMYIPSALLTEVAISFKARLRHTLKDIAVARPQHSSLCTLRGTSRGKVPASPAAYCDAVSS